MFWKLLCLALVVAASNSADALAADSCRNTVWIRVPKTMTGTRTCYRDKPCSTFIWVDVTVEEDCVQKEFCGYYCGVPRYRDVTRKCQVTRKEQREVKYTVQEEVEEKFTYEVEVWVEAPADCSEMAEAQAATAATADTPRDPSQTAVVAIHESTQQANNPTDFAAELRALKGFLNELRESDREIKAQLSDLSGRLDAQRIRAGDQESAQP